MPCRFAALTRASFMLCSFLTAAITALPATAGERQQLGYGRLVTNDLIGDGRDRWRTGSVASSRVWGPKWTGALPETFGRLLELRLNFEAIAPEQLNAPAAGDRPYAGAISVGLHSHHQIAGTEFALGGDLVFTGPQTGIDDFQDFMHDYLGGEDINSRTRNAQIGDDINPTAVAEIGRPIRLGQSARLRPFVEMRAGVETLARVGADLSFGRIGQGELLLRDPVTGHRYRSIRSSGAGMGFVFGGDIAYVDHSEYLPSNQGYQLTDSRTRLRTGLHVQTEAGHRFFYGLTWLGKEFEAQREEQLVGSVRINLEF
ncbi:lipid A-modifier LpxR family protein [Roseovarius sp. C7]|uniref:lipid A-modifier LpxR family protein n=1 Tax=Roseovarius sp. C7 TaxID=3398643 RepID=UPI0039F6CF03